MIYALIISILAGLVAVGFLLAALQASKKGAAQDKATIADLQKQVTALAGALKLEQEARGTDKARLEAVVKGLKDEIHTLEQVLATCNDPLSIAGRLNKLLSL